MNLADFQDAFSQIILAPDPPDSESIASLKNIAQTDMSVKKIALYRERVIRGLAQQLRAQYPTVYCIVGDAFLRSVVLPFFQKYPPKSTHPQFLAAAFPDFLAEYEAAAHFPYLPDVAMVDLGYLRAYHAAHAPSLPLNQFIQQKPEELVNRTVTLHPACFWLSSRYAIYDIWRLYHDTDPSKHLDHRLAQQVVIVRPELNVEVHAATPGLIKALDALDDATTLGEAFSRASAEDADFNLDDALQFLIKHGVITGLSP